MHKNKAGQARLIYFAFSALTLPELESLLLPVPPEVYCLSAAEAQIW